jgi:hypothetical protein
MYYRKKVFFFVVPRKKNEANEHSAEKAEVREQGK